MDVLIVGTNPLNMEQTQWRADIGATGVKVYQLTAPESNKKNL